MEVICARSCGSLYNLSSYHSLKRRQALFEQPLMPKITSRKQFPFPFPSWVKTKMQYCYYI